MKDFFISYTGKDRSWAEWVAWTLEEAGHSVVIQAWDFRPGGNFVLDMQRATTEAKRTIAVLSALYFDKPFPQSEWAAAFAQDPTSRDRKLIPLRVEDCTPPGLLAQVVYIDVFDCEEGEAQQRLLSAVTDGRMKPTTRPSFPGKASERSVPNPVPFPGVTAPNPTSPPAPTLSLSAYDAQTWVGRDELIADLTHKLESGYRILALTGITGIGKTALAEHLVVNVQGNGMAFHRLNFDDRGQGRDFLSGALSLLPRLGEVVTTADQQDPQNALQHLLTTLRTRPFLIQIDSLEMLLEGSEEGGWNAFKEGLWVDFFQQLCSRGGMLEPAALDHTGSTRRVSAGRVSVSPLLGGAVGGRPLGSGAVGLVR
ncbi:toll/interleukin-1 receptor domain-containing protein (plasmid) [Kovacikia minuta CCNUW1]|uniref:toll/interleukin-1 receptor domain-containing protein n=1 Tax=Kovacikia minuta TaxID=2931930 RepID=UPI001CCF077D|nr:toll/interleukin-1 receptor domain-containing protein [Kovacikia minuta]UBF30080.1 toll/interleukin-1 receptor domain-containing protein [Kovacikia minuta CCNUW1]